MSNEASTSARHKTDTSQESEASEDSGKNEGVELNWAYYQPPPGAKLITANEDNGVFDWDAVNNNNDVEVWVMRVPDTISSKDFEGLSLDLSTSSVSKNGRRQTTRIGTLKRKHTSYDIWSLGDEHENIKSSDGHVVGGEELRSLSCLLPRKSKSGELYQTPKPIARHLVVSAPPPVPTTSHVSSVLHTNPPRHKYSPERLTHRFLPYGALVDPTCVRPTVKVVKNPKEDEEMTPEPSPMEVDTSPVQKTEEKVNTTAKRKKGEAEKAVMEVQANADDVVEDARTEPKVEKDRKGKKRKGDDVGESYQKKLKKVKTTSR